jgi:hypothetical protein
MSTSNAPFTCSRKLLASLFCHRVRAFFADQVLEIQRCEDAEDAGAGKVAAAVAMYASVGKALRLRHGQEGEVPLQRAVDIVYGTKVATAKPFIVLDGPSGVGKTQQTFALKGFKVVYMLVHTWEAGLISKQPIYKAFNEVSDEMRRCVTSNVQSQFIKGRRFDYCTFEGSITTSGLKLLLNGVKLLTTGLIYAAEPCTRESPR